MTYRACLARYPTTEHFDGDVVLAQAFGQLKRVVHHLMVDCARAKVVFHALAVDYNLPTAWIKSHASHRALAASRAIEVGRPILCLCLIHSSPLRELLSDGFQYASLCVDAERLGLLGCMRVLSPCIYLQLGNHLRAQAVARQHTLDGCLNGEGRVLLLHNVERNSLERPHIA